MFRAKKKIEIYGRKKRDNEAECQESYLVGSWKWEGLSNSAKDASPSLRELGRRSWRGTFHPVLKEARLLFTLYTQVWL